MSKKNRYDDEFKKAVVNEYLKGTSTVKIASDFGIAKSTVSGWAHKYSEECQYTQPQNITNIQNADEIRALNKRISELEKENNFLKKQRHSSQRKSISGISIY